MPDHKPDAGVDFPTLRQSMLADFDLCALLSHFEREYRSGWTGHPQARGHLFHLFAAKALQEMWLQQEDHIEPDVGHAILAEVLRQQDMAPEGIVNIPMRQVRDLHWVVTKWCHDNVWDIQNLVDVEKRLYGDLQMLHPNVKRRLTGQLDALFIEGEQADHAIVVDWKDTWAMPSPSELDDKGYFQQRFYSWLVFRNYPAVQRMTLREFYVRFSEPREATVWRDDLDDIEQQLVALVERFDRTYNEQVFPPSPGKHCQLCPNPAGCPIPDLAKGDGAVRDEETAKKVAARLIKAEAITKQARKSLQGYAEIHGPIPVRAAKGRVVWGFKESTRVNRPTRDELEVALRSTDARLDLDRLYRTTKSTRFSQHAPAESPTDEPSLVEQLERSLQELKQSDGAGTTTED